MQEGGTGERELEEDGEEKEEEEEEKKEEEKEKEKRLSTKGGLPASVLKLAF